jgi:hypothetical protein
MEFNCKFNFICEPWSERIKHRPKITQGWRATAEIHRLKAVKFFAGSHNRPRKA